jgi:hypothetical protein
MHISSKILFLYDKFTQDQTDIKPMSNTSLTISPFFEDCSISSVVVEVDDIKNLKNYNEDFVKIYPIDLGDVDFETFLDNVPLSSIATIKNECIPLLFYLPTEGFSFRDRDNWLDKIEQSLTRRGIRDVKKYLITGNLKENHNSFFDKIFPVNYFESHFNRFVKSDTESFDESTMLHFKKNIHQHSFLSYNGNLKPHRLALVSELTRLNLTTDALVSFLQGTDVYYSNYLFNQLIRSTTSLLDYALRIENLKSLKIDFQTHREMMNDNYNYKIIHPHYLESWFSLVTETEYDEDSLFLTEKIYKPIYGLHPFIVWGSPGILKQLKQDGYETFPELFDESYDDVYDHKKRLSMVLDEVSKFNNKSNLEKKDLIYSICEKLVNNKKNFLKKEKSYKKQIIKIFEEIKNDIEKDNT